MTRKIFFTVIITLIFVSVMFAQDMQKRAFTLAFSDPDIEFNPHYSIYAHEAQLFTGIYEGLFTYNPMNIEPVRSSVQRYNLSNDNKTYTFYLRKDAKWSDGSPLKAEHFRNAWLEMINPATKTDYAAFFDIISGVKNYRLGKNKDISKVGISIISDDVLQVTLENPVPYFTRLLCHHSFSPVHPLMQKQRDWSKNPSSILVNGPYMIKSADREKIILVKNPHYWDSKSVKIETINVLFIDNGIEATSRYNGGEIDWIAGSFDLDNLIDSKSIQANPMFATHYWYFNCSKAPWSDAQVRQALQYLIPWDDIRTTEIYMIPANELVLPVRGYKGANAINKQNIEKANELLEKAGFKNGQGLPPVVISYPDFEDSRRIAEIMKKSWETIGIEVNLQPKISGRIVYSDSNEYTISVTSWIGDFADPMAFLQMWTSDSNLNSAFYSDTKYDSLILDSMKEVSEKRMAILQKAEQILLDSGAVMPIYHQLSINIISNSNILGWYKNPLDIHPLKYLEFGIPNALPNVVRQDKNSDNSVFKTADQDQFWLNVNFLSLKENLSSFSYNLTRFN